MMGENSRQNKLLLTVFMFFVLGGGLYFLCLVKLHAYNSFYFKRIVFLSCSILAFCFMWLLPLKNLKKDGLLNNSIFVGFFLGVMILINKANILNLPFYWDEQWTMWHADKIFKNNLWPFSSAAPFDTGHPFFYFECLAIFWKIFGQKIIVSHLVGLGFVWIALFYLYLLGKNILNDSRIGFVAAILFFYNPVCYSHFGTLVLDVPLTALLMVSTYALLRRNYLVFSIFSCFLVLTKSYAVGFVVILLVLNSFILIRSEKEYSRPSGRDYLLMGFPIMVYILWFIFHYRTSGVLLYSDIFAPYNSLHSLGLQYFFRARHVMRQLFLYGNKFLTIVIVYYFCVDRLKQKTFWSLKIFFISLILISAFALSLAKNYCPRWFIPLYPFFYILGVSGLIRLFEENKIILVKGIFFLTALFSLLRYDMHGSGADSVVYNMEYVDAIVVTQQATDYIEKYFPSAAILTTWPFEAALRHPMLGYVKKPLNVVYKKQKFDMLVYDGQSMEIKKNETTKKILSKNKNFVLIKRFEQNNKFIEIYRVAWKKAFK